MASLKLDSNNGYLVVVLQKDESRADEAQAIFPFVWLRDNCQCPDCFDPCSQDRQFVLKDLDTEIQPVDVKLTNGDEELSITWPDQHESRYALSWLWQRRFEQKCWANHDKMLHLPQRLWYAKDMENSIPQVEYDKLLEDDRVLFDWLVNLEVYGICLITKAPTKVGVLPNIGARISHLFKCHYGETAEVKLSMSSSNLAYTSKALGLHTDFPNLEYAPEMQMLHCIQQAKVKGGDSTLVDAFQVSKDMERDNEKCFQTLCNTLVDFEDVGEFNYRFQTQTKKPTIECDRAGNVMKVSYSNAHRDSVLSVPVEQVKPFYSALKLFDKMINDPKYCIRHKLNPGEIMCFDNFRVMHGREAFSETQAGERHLDTGYIGWDYLKSKRRVLQRQLSVSDDLLNKYYA